MSRNWKICFSGLAVFQLVFLIAFSEKRKKLLQKVAMARHGKSKLPGMNREDKAPSSSSFKPREGVLPEELGDEQGHVLVVTQFGLAMIVAGLRSIEQESPEVSNLLDSLETALAEGAEERMKNA